MNYRITYRCISHRGRLRRMNQDNYICDRKYMQFWETQASPPLSGQVTSKGSTLFGVFDGMGGEEYGELASWLAAQCASEVVLRDKPVAALTLLCKTANQKICDYVLENGLTSMGTTAAMLAFTPKGITVCNIGDSKIYLFNQDGLTQISMDHVSVAPFGTKPPLSQNLGIPPEEMIIAPYFSQGDYHHGDRYLICSDGLTDMVTDPEISQILSDSSLDDAQDSLLKLALKNGGKDNITILLFEIERTGLWSFRS